MKSSLVIVSFLLLAFSCEVRAGENQDEERRHVEKTGGFSFVVPDDWKIRELSGAKYKLIAGPIRDEFASNICVVDEPSKLSLAEYVKAGLPRLKRGLKKVEVVKQEAFATTAGLKGFRLVIEDEQNGKRLRQSIYIFETAGTKYVVTCSTLADGGDKLDPVFEQAMKTFRFEKR